MQLGNKFEQIADVRKTVQLLFSIIRCTVGSVTGAVTYLGTLYFAPLLTCYYCVKMKAINNIVFLFSRVHPVIVSTVAFLKLTASTTFKCSIVKAKCCLTKLSCLFGRP